MTEFVATSVARRLIARMHATHDRRRISVFAGPPGIGKTTAIDQLVTQLGGGVAVVKVARRNAREVLVLQHTLDAIRRLTSGTSTHFPTSVWELRNDIFNAICVWVGCEPAPARRGEYELEAFPKLTIVFDEAQNLSREAIESLRYWNDADRCYAPFPIGLIFVGNNEFSLQTDLDGRSVISAAVADRALYVQAFEYADVTDDDLRLYLDLRAQLEPPAMDALIGIISNSRTGRSFRRVDDLLEEIGSDGLMSLELVREALSLV